MKKIICLIGVFVVMFELTGCIFRNNTNVRTEELSRQSKSEMDRIYEVEDVLVKALENKDEELLKSLFSEKALSRSGDIEKGIDYIFNLYQGEFVEIVERNHGSDEHIEKGKSTKDVSAWCLIKTSKATYKLSWVDWMKQDADPTAVGIYCLQMSEYQDGVYNSYYDIAGIEYPEREVVHSSIKGINGLLEEQNQEYFQTLLSQNVLSNIPEVDLLADKVFNLFPHYKYSDKKDGWVTYSEIDGELRQNVFLEIRGENADYIMYFCYDAVATDKISILKFTKIEEGKSITEYELGDTYTQSGIYLP